jgi:negative regulator of flagellin synthesis FlgM
MKIDPGPKQVTQPTSVENRPVQPKANKPADAEQTEVTLSPRAAQLKQLEAQLAAIPVVDRARVDSIKEAISSGQYTINTDNIAGGLLDSVKEMLHVAK